MLAGAMRRVTALCALMIVLGACATSGRTRLSAASENDPDAAAAAAVAAQARSQYRIAPGDELDLAVYQDNSFDRKVRVGPDGALSLPLAGTVPVAGATLDEARARIARQLAAYLVNPQVSLSVDTSGIKQLFVLGEVEKPGPYPIPAEGVTVLQAISDAGGFTKVAAPRRTHVLRYVGGRSVDYKIDLKALIQNGERDKDLILEPNDVVYVPQALF